MNISRCSSRLFQNHPHSQRFSSFRSFFIDSKKFLPPKWSRIIKPLAFGGIGIGIGSYYTQGSSTNTQGNDIRSFAKLETTEVPQLFWEPLDTCKSSLSQEESEFLKNCTTSKKDLFKLQEMMIQRKYARERWPEDLCVFLNRYEGLQELVNLLLQSDKIFEMKKHTFDALYQIAKSREIAFSWGDREENVFLNRLECSREEEMWNQQPECGVYMMLRMNPSLAFFKGLDNKSAFSLAVEKGCTKTARMILSVMEQQSSSKDVMFTQTDFWNQVAIMDSIEFEDQVFSALSKEMQEHVYRMANVHQATCLVEKLNRLGMKGRCAVKDPYPCDVLNKAMDVVQAKETLFLFLHDLRNKNLLMLENEFDAYQKETGVCFVRKGSLGRLIGRCKVERAICALKLKHIKVPKKIAVVNPASNEISIGTETGRCKIYSNDMTVYAERITGCDRLLPWEEMQELLTLLKYVKFGDIWSHNFIIAEDGVYLIDMEDKSFELPFEYQKLNRLTDMIHSNDLPRLQKWISRNQPMNTSLFSTWEKRENDSRRLRSYFGWDLRILPFSFPVDDIISANKKIEAVI